MAVSLSHFSPCKLSHPQTLPKPSHFLCFSSKSSLHSIQSNNSKTPSQSQNPTLRTDAIHLSNHLRKSLLEENYTESLSVIETMASQGYKLHIKSCADLIKRLSSEGKLNQADRVISLIESHGQAQTVLYNVFITGLCKKSKFMPALETIGRMRANRCRPNTVTCNIIVGCLCNRGMLDLAFETVEYFKEYQVPPDLITYTQLIEGTFVEKGFKEGLRLFDEMESRGILPDQALYCRVVNAMCRAGQIDEVLQVLGAISACGVKLYFSSYSELLETLVENKRFGDADKVIEEMLVRECWMSHNQLDFLVNMLCTKGLVDKARVLIEGLVKGKWMKPGYKCCNLVIGTFIKEGRLKEAIDFINNLITMRVPNISFYNPILSALCNYGHVHHAVEALNKLEKVGCCSPDRVTYTALIGALWSFGDHVGSVKMMSQFLERGLKPDEITYGAIISCLCKDGMVDEAMEIMRVMGENGVRVTVQIYDILLVGFCKVGRVNDAINLLEEMFEGGCEVNERSLVILLKGVAHIGYESEAGKIAEELVLSNFLSPDGKISSMSSSAVF